MKPCRFSFPLSILIVLWICLPALAASFTGEVFRIVDGDTIEVLFNEQPIRISLRGIDCPDRDQAYGTEAKQFTSDFVFQKNVKVVVIDQDQLGRISGEVLLPDGRSLNRELVRAGLAWWHREQASDDRELEALQKAARKSKKGLWADPQPIPPWEYRKSR